MKCPRCKSTEIVYGRKLLGMMIFYCARCNKGIYDVNENFVTVIVLVVLAVIALGSMYLVYLGSIDQQTFEKIIIFIAGVIGGWLGNRGVKAAIKR